MRTQAWMLIIGIGTSLGCTAALTSSNSASQGMGSVSSVSEQLADSGSSMSSSSSEGEEAAALEQDVSTYTALFSETGADVNAYLRGVGALAESYAVSDWEREPAVARGIARGLAGSRLSDQEIGHFIERVASGDPQMQDSLRAAAIALR